MKLSGLGCQWIMLFVLMLLGSAALAQSGTIKGRVTTSDDQPAPYVTITAVGSSRNVITDEAGFYTLTKVPAGDYELEASFVGYETLKKI
ncbi:carboxypeptidase-like regulatory domain-containing protein [Niabella hibiscisoli]|uniref:carboxypeptidase-like regulatory domain-containing protein n=1 Tax=Niabella hibiscisoli TaxID=1825928 RepID=UPI001F100BA1|nr:carboxypeptidase-like regulatory domain-containing protein [Niabella hibiscisoli]MCH5720136.1 carboxypeptidase-like regulatory domain-containing protein [Niabella hibiscisoli]